MRMRFFISFVVLFVFLSLLTGCLAVERVATKVLYPYERVNRSHKVPETPPPGYSETFFELQSYNGEAYKVHAWYRGAEDADVTIIYLHGNGENIGALYKVGFFKVLDMAPLNVIVIDYPSYGRSEGPVSEDTLVGGAVAAALFAKEVFPEDKLILWGWSLGAAVAIQAFAQVQNRADGLILTSPWTSLYDIAVHKVKAARNLSASWLAQNGFDSASVASQIEKPVLIHHGNRDPVIPIQFGRELASKMAFARFVELTREHNDILNERTLWEDIVAFARDIAKAEPTDRLVEDRRYFTVSH